MTDLIIADALTLDASGLQLTQDGYLIGDAKVSRAFNVQQYYGHELGLTDSRKNDVFGVYRPEDLVFESDSMRSLAGRPVTRGHPPGGVTSKNWKDLAVGQVGGIVRRDGEHVVAPMAIMDAVAAKEVQDGARSLSAGYTVGIVEESGIAPDGTPYRFKQTGPLRYNHVAYLPDNNPRAGNTRIGDWRVIDENEKTPKPTSGGRNMADNMRKVVVDGLTIETTEQGAQMIERLTKQVGDANTALTVANTANQTSLAAKDAALAAKDAEIATLKAAALSDADLDARVSARSDLIATAKGIHDADYAGKSESEIKLIAVTAKIGDAEVKGKEAPYIDAYFNILAKDAKKVDPVREAIRARDSRTNDNDNGQGAYEARLRDAWKGPAAQGAK